MMPHARAAATNCRAGSGCGRARQVACVPSQAGGGVRACRDGMGKVLPF
jgi:hypothetical protein